MNGAAKASPSPFAGRTWWLVGGASGVAAGIVLRGWDAVEPAIAPIAGSGAALLSDGLGVLPAGIAAAVTAHPGVACLALVLGQMVRYPGGDAQLLLLAGLQAAFAAVLPELWLASRPPRRGPFDLAVMGALVAPGSVVAGRLFAPNALADGLVWPTLVSGALGGAVVAAIAAVGVASVRHRLERCPEADE